MLFLLFWIIARWIKRWKEIYQLIWASNDMILSFGSSLLSIKQNIAMIKHNIYKLGIQVSGISLDFISWLILRNEVGLLVFVPNIIYIRLLRSCDFPGNCSAYGSEVVISSDASWFSGNWRCKSLLDSYAYAECSVIMPFSCRFCSYSFTVWHGEQNITISITIVISPLFKCF